MAEIRIDKLIQLEAIEEYRTRGTGRTQYVMRVVPADGWPVVVRIEKKLFQELKEDVEKELAVALDTQASKKRVFPVGARVWVDGADEAVIRQSFPMGRAPNQLFPHYLVDYVSGDKNVTVRSWRVKAKEDAE